jgi:hypothetical protein
MSKLIEAMAQKLAKLSKSEHPDLWHHWVPDAAAVLAAMCEGEALEEMVERVKRLYEGITPDQARNILRAALTVEP